MDFSLIAPIAVVISIAISIAILALIAFLVDNISITVSFGEVFFYGLCVIGLTFAMIFCIHSYDSEKNYYEQLDVYMDSGYAVYINGIEVDPEKIVINNYSKNIIEINDEQHEIYIAANK